MGNMDEEAEVTQSQVHVSNPSNTADEQPSQSEDNTKHHEHKKHKKKKKKHKHKDRDKDKDHNENELQTEVSSEVTNTEQSAEDNKPNGILTNAKSSVDDDNDTMPNNASSENADTEMKPNQIITSPVEDNDTIKPIASSVEDHGTKGKSSDEDDIISSGEDAQIMEKDKRKLLKRRQSYKEEKHVLKKKLADTKTKFEEEISKYEKDLDAKRQEYLSRMSELKLDEQYTSLTKQMEDVAELEQAIDTRLQQCTEQQQEVEDLERFLDRRQQLCNSRDAKLENGKSELDTLHQELELDRERLERAGFDTSNIGNRKDRNRSLNASFSSQWGGSSVGGDDDYIVKANLRKCQAKLKKSEETLVATNEQLATLKEQVHALEVEKKKNVDKIKHLETQLSVALSQLSHKTIQSKDSTIDRHKSNRTHVNRQRLSSANLSINQQAQLRRSQRESTAPSSNSSKYALSPSSPNSVMGKSDGRSSPLSSEGSPSTSTSMAFLQQGNRSPRTDDGTVSRAESTTSSQRTVSTTCSVM